MNVPEIEERWERALDAVNSALLANGIQSLPYEQFMRIALEAFVPDYPSFHRFEEEYEALVHFVNASNQYINELKSIDRKKRINCLVDGGLDDIVALVTAQKQEADERLAVLEALKPRERKRPIESKGKKSLHMFEQLREGGINDIWVCSKIIAHVFNETGIDGAPAKKLTKSVYDRLTRLEVR